MAPIPPVELDARARMLADNTQRLTTALVVLAPTAGSLFVSFLFTPEDVESGRVILSAPCMTKTVFGFGCPTCGMTRAFMSLSHGQATRAVHYNVLSPAAYVAFWILAFGSIIAVLRALRARRRLLHLLSS